MYLIVGSTELEISKLKENRELARTEDFGFLITGVGVVESAISLTRFLSEAKTRTNARWPDGVILFGVCGAYLDAGANVLDICLAEQEHFGDFGIAISEKTQYFTEETLKNQSNFDLKNEIFAKINETLVLLQIPHKNGHFVTVNSCTGTGARGDFLRDKFNAICENMEGAALARVCELFGLSMVELRCASNIVEDRDKSKWKIKEAVAKGSDALAKVLVELQSRGN